MTRMFRWTRIGLWALQFWFSGLHSNLFTDYQRKKSKDFGSGPF